MAEENLDIKKRQSRKTIGEEGSRMQTVFVFTFLLILGLLLYLPGRLKTPSVSIKWPQPGNGEVITIRKKTSSLNRARPRPDIGSIINDLTGDIGVVVKGINTDDELLFNQDKVMTAASVIKLPVLVVYYQAVDNGSFDPSDEYVLNEADRWEYGTGSMQYQPAGKVYTYRQVAQLVANQSDNMGAEVLIKKLGGYTKVQLAINRLGYSSINLKENEISTAEAADLFWQLAQGKILKQASQEELFNNLTDTVNEDRIPAGVPEGISVIHKFGSETGVVNDCGIVEAGNPYVICILSTGVNVGEVEPLFPRISAAAWDWLGD